MQEVEQLQKPRAQSFNAIKDSLNEELLKGIPLREQEQVEIEQEAVRILEEVRKIDVYSEDFTAKTALSDRLKEILDIAGTRKQQVIDINSAFTKRNFQGMEDSAAKTAIDELKDVLIEYDPSKFNLTEPDRILNFIPLPDSVGKKN